MCALQLHSVEVRSPAPVLLTITSRPTSLPSLLAHPLSVIKLKSGRVRVRPLPLPPPPPPPPSPPLPPPAPPPTLRYTALATHPQNPWHGRTTARVCVRMCVGRFTCTRACLLLQTQTITAPSVMPRLYPFHWRERAVLLMQACLSRSLVLWLSLHDQYRASSSFASFSASRASSSACSVAHAPALAFELEARAANADRRGVYLRVVYVVYRRRSLD